MATPQVTVIAPGFKRHRADRRAAGRNSGSNAVEERDVLLGFDKARYSLVLRAMLSGDIGCQVDRAGVADLGRSEERRVGKECRSRCSPHHKKKKMVK